MSWRASPTGEPRPCAGPLPLHLIWWRDYNLCPGSVSADPVLATPRQRRGQPATGIEGRGVCHRPLLWGASTASLMSCVGQRSALTTANSGPPLTQNRNQLKTSPKPVYLFVDVLVRRHRKKPILAIEGTKLVADSTNFEDEVRPAKWMPTPKITLKDSVNKY